MSDVEKLGGLRRRLMMGMLVCWALWYGPIVLLLSPWFTPAGHHLLAIASEIFALPWSIALVWLVLVERRIKARPAVFAALNDEMTVRNRWRASRFTTGVMMVCLIVGIGVATFVHISALPALAFLLWILVVTKLGSYIWFDRSE